MDKQKISLIIIFLFFFSAVLTLILSGLSLAKVISLQNDLSILFFQELQSKEIFSALVSSLIFAFQSAILPLLPFVIFSSLGFLSMLYFKPEVKYLLAVLTAVLISSILIKFSIALAIICMGFFPSALFFRQEERKTAFKTASAFISSCIRWQNIFIATAVFFGIFLMPNFESLAEQSMLSSISTLLPQDLQAAQTEAVRTLVDQCTLSAKNIVENEYIKSGAPQQCENFRNSAQSALDNYKAQATAQIENATVQQLELPQFGFLSAFAKSIPLTSAIAVLFLLELLKPLFVSLFSLIYSFAIRK